MESVWFNTSYQSFTTSDLCTFIFRDELGNFIDARTFVITVDGNQIYGDTFLWADITSNVSLVIKDIFDHTIYSNASFIYERFIDFEITFYSVKFENIQPLPVWVELESNGQTFSSWIYHFEVQEFMMYGGNYNFTIHYCDAPDTSFEEVVTNGTSSTYNIFLDTDTAMLINGDSLSDVFGNIVSLSSSLDNFNVTLTNQIISVNITVINLNTTVSNQIVNIDIQIDNLNTTLSEELVSFQTDIENINSTIYQQTIDILSKVSSYNSTLFSQTVTIINNISNLNSTLYQQTIDILTDIEQINATLYAETVSIITLLDEVNDTIIVQILVNQAALADLQLFNELYKNAYFSLSTMTGVGLPFETAIVKVNGTRIYNSLQIYATNTTLNVTVWSFGEVFLTNQTVKMTSNTEITLLITYVKQAIKNPYNVEIMVYYTSGTMTWNFLLPSNTTVMIDVFYGTYTIRCLPIGDEESLTYFNSTHEVTYRPYTLYDTQLDGVRTFSVKVSLDAKPLGDTLTQEEKENVWSKLEILGLSATALIALAISSLLAGSIRGVILGGLNTIMKLFGFDIDVSPENISRYDYDLRQMMMLKRQATSKTKKKGKKRGFQSAPRTNMGIVVVDRTEGNPDWEKIRTKSVANKKKKKQQTAKKKQGTVKVS